MGRFAGREYYIRSRDSSHLVKSPYARVGDVAVALFGEFLENDGEMLFGEGRFDGADGIDVGILAAGNEEEAQTLIRLALLGRAVQDAADRCHAADEVAGVEREVERELAPFPMPWSTTRCGSTV